MKASILAIGTELTSGQINNSNGQWISKMLKQHGIVTGAHLVVPDEPEIIQNALKFSQELGTVLFVTGGLGPTSDDLTREMIAQWSGQKLVYDEASWRSITERLSPRGIPVKEIQRQQCFFPEGASILQNRMGTANGFCLNVGKQTVFVLPGPPGEIAAVWEDHINSWLVENTKNLDATLTWSWDCLGVPESEVARRAEAALLGCHLEKAYRVHLPYVEFKLSFLKSELAVATTYANQLDKAFLDLKVTRDQQDVAKKLCQLLEPYPAVKIIDRLSNGFLLHRIYPFAKSLFKKNSLEILQKPKSENTESLVLELSP